MSVPNTEGSEMRRWPTLEDQFQRYSGKTAGFDYLRIILAVGVLVWHSYGLAFGRVSIDAVLNGGWLQTLIYSILPMFFALSGFLVTASLIRANSLYTYVVFRGLRLFPALSVEIILAALVLGPIMTVLTMGEYFSHTQFHYYFLNLFGLVQYRLPGVFEDAPYPYIVNGSLWTIPYELECYIYLIFFSAIGVFRGRYFVLVAYVVVTIVAIQLGARSSSEGIVIILKNLLIEETALQPNLQLATNADLHPNRIVVLSFLAGTVLYVWRDKVPYSPILAALALCLSVWWLSSVTMFFFAPLPIAYLTVWLGLQNPKRISILKKGDYSYGIYLYAFPIQQVISSTGIHGESYILHILMSLAFVSLFAAFSWHWIEKPALSLKKHFFSN